MPRSKKTYKCELCGMIMNKKNDYDKHKASNIPCTSNDAIQNVNIGDTTRIAKDSIKQLLSRMLDILRDSESITGGYAMRQLHKLLTLRMIKPIVIGAKPKIKLTCGNYEDISIEYRDILESCIDFDKLSEVVDNELLQTIKDLRYCILKDSICFGDMFSEPFEIKNTSTYRKLFNMLRDFPFEKIGHDIFGDVYEQILSTTMTGRDFAQFLTPSTLRDFMVKLVDPQFNNDGTFETIIDPTMGTAGFLISSYRYLHSKAKENGVEINENFIANVGLNGCEIVADTYGLAQSNILVNTGTISYKCVRQDSIRNPIKGQYDIVLANPPFGVKGLDYDNILFDPDAVGFNKYDYIPIRSSKASVIVLQICIHLLKIGGRCAIVMPYGGQETNSAGDFAKIREYLLRSCEVHAVINNVSKDGGNIFEYAGPNTCIIYFTKKAEPFVYVDIDGVKQYDTNNCVLIPQYRQQRKKNVLPTFLGFAANPYICHTKEIKFQTLNIYTKTGRVEIDDKETLIVPVSEILQNGCVFSPMKYRKNVYVGNIGNISTMKLGDLIELKNGTFNTSEKTDNGNIPFYNCSIDGKIGTHHTESFDYSEYIILIRAGGSKDNPTSVNTGIGKVFYITGKIAAHHGICALIPKTDIIMVKYLYHFLDLNKQKIANIATYFTGIGKIKTDDILEFPISVPSLETQQIIVTRCDDLQSLIEENKKIIDLLKKQNTDKIRYEIDGYRTSVKLGDLTEFREKSIRQAGEKQTSGKYRFYTSGMSENYYCDTADYTEETVIVGAGGLSSINIDREFSCSVDNHLIYSIKPDVITNKFIYTYLQNNFAKLTESMTGAVIKHLLKDHLTAFSIPVPTLEHQQQIVDYCDANNTLIEQLEQNIKTQQCDLKNTMTNILDKQQPNINIPQYQIYITTWMQKNGYDFGSCITEQTNMSVFTYTSPDGNMFNYFPYIYEYNKYAVFLYSYADSCANDNLINSVMSTIPNIRKLILLIDNNTVTNAIDNFYISAQ